MKGPVLSLLPPTPLWPARLSDQTLSFGQELQLGTGSKTEKLLCQGLFPSDWLGNVKLLKTTHKFEFLWNIFCKTEQNVAECSIREDQGKIHGSELVNYFAWFKLLRKWKKIWKLPALIFSFKVTLLCRQDDLSWSIFDLVWHFSLSFMQISLFNFWFTIFFLFLSTPGMAYNCNFFFPLFC